MQYYRTVYSILDLLSDMGGMTASFSSICVLLISGINYFGSYQFLMGDSFYSRTESGRTGPFLSGTQLRYNNHNDV